MRILVHSNAPWLPTGYGQQTAQLARRLRDDGHDVAISAAAGLHGGGFIEWEGLRVLPMLMDPYGNDSLAMHAVEAFDGPADVVLTLMDVQTLDPRVLRELPAVCWTPVDHEPASSSLVGVLQQSRALPVAMSLHGHAELSASGLDARYAPLGVDTAAFRPLPRGEARASLGLPADAFVVGMVGANSTMPARKGFGEAVQAFAAFQRPHDDAVLYLHTDMSGDARGGAWLDRLLRACDVPSRAVAVSPQYEAAVVGMASERMAVMYSAFDVLLNPSWGEGFGLPIVEAQACGTPVIVTDCTAMAELAGPGWSVRGQRVWSAHDAWQTVPSVEGIVAALEDARLRAPELRPAARRFAAAYDAAGVFAEHWRPLLVDLERAHALGGRRAPE